MRTNKTPFIVVFPLFVWLAGCVNTQPTLSQYAADTNTNPSHMQVVLDCSLMADTSIELLFDLEYNERLCAAFAKEAQAFLLTDGPSAVDDVEVAEISLGASRPRAFAARSTFSGNHIERSSPATHSLPIVNGKAAAYENTAYPRLGYRVWSILEKSPLSTTVGGHGCCIDNEALNALNNLSAQTIGSNVDDDKLTLFVTVSGRYKLEKESDIEEESEIEDESVPFISSTFRPDARTGGAKQTYYRLDGMSLLASALLINTYGDVLWSAVGGPPIHTYSATKAGSVKPACIAHSARNAWEQEPSILGLDLLRECGGTRW